MRIADAILDLLYPRKCPFCRKILDKKEWLICKQCEKDLPYSKSGGIQHGNFFTACLSPLYYKESVRSALLRYKFYGLTVYAKPFGQLMSDCAEEYIDAQVDIITWVPLSRKRLNKRGYDQARLLAEELSCSLMIPCEPVLKKKIHTRPQSRTGSAEKRKANISGAYEVIAPEKVSGKTILLVDDIVTTGSTFSECARMLGMSGANRVYCIAVARKSED